MNIVHIAPYYPSEHAVHAGGVCMGMELKELEKKNKVFSLSFVQKEYDLDIFNNEAKDNSIGILLDRKKKLLNILKHIYMPTLFASRSSKEFTHQLEKILYNQNINAVHAEYSAMGQYFNTIKKHENIKITYVLHDVSIQGFYRAKKESKRFMEKVYNQIQYHLVKKYEGKWLRQADEILVFNNKDKNLINEIYGIDDVKIINTYFALERKEDKLNKYYRKKEDTINYFFFGQLKRKENKLAAIDAINIFNKLQEKNIEDKDLKLYIIGNAPDEELETLESDNVIITGFVDDIDKFIIQNCDIAIFPLTLGAGIKVKVLHCMALGIPVITTDVGAEGIDEQGKHLYLANTEAEILEGMINMLDREKRMQYKSCQQYVSEKFNWTLTEDILDIIYQEEMEL